MPQEILDSAEAVKDNDEEIKKLGIEIGTTMSQRLLDAGVPGLHMYTLNLERSALAILENLGLIKGRVGFPLATLSLTSKVLISGAHTSYLWLSGWHGMAWFQAAVLHYQTPIMAPWMGTIPTGFPADTFLAAVLVLPALRDL